MKERSKKILKKMENEEKAEEIQDRGDQIGHLPSLSSSRSPMAV